MSTYSKIGVINTILQNYEKDYISIGILYDNCPKIFEYIEERKLRNEIFTLIKDLGGIENIKTYYSQEVIKLSTDFNIKYIIPFSKPELHKIKERLKLAGIIYKKETPTNNILDITIEPSYDNLKKYMKKKTTF